MAKKKVEEATDSQQAPAAADKVTPAPHPKSLNVAVTEALAAGVSMELVEGKRPVLRQWIKDKWPGYDFADGSLNVAVSKMTGGTRTRAKTAEPALSSSPTADELMMIKKEIDESEETLDQYLAVINGVNTLADKVGGVPRLLKCLETLKAFGCK